MTGKPSYYATLEWHDQIPLAVEYNDYYFSKNSAIAESRYVFLEHNFLAERFAKLTEDDIFVIGETGFGSGRNFLVTMDLWYKQNSTGTLHYISIEKHPLAPADLARILANFPELNSIKDDLLAQYYLPLPGFHRLSFGNNIFLTLIIGDAETILPELEAIVNAWYLDGFSPAKNEQLWTEKLISQMARLSKSDTTFATYSASSALRNKLSEAGFTVNKDNGFGGKRDMLYGKYQTPAIQLSDRKFKRKYLAIPAPVLEKEVIVIGAGISGAATAYSLAKRGFQVTVIEQHTLPAQEASGNYQGMLYGSWSAFGGVAMELSFAGYRYSHHLIRQLLEKPDDYDSCGLIQLAESEEQLKRQQQLLNCNLPEDFFRPVNRSEIEQLAGITIKEEQTGLYFPHGLWLNPPALVSWLLDHPNIRLITNCKVKDIVYQNSCWQAIDDKSITRASAANLVICNSYRLREFTPTKHLQLRTIRGQISIANKPEKPLQTILCGKGYMTPSRQGKITIGATFQFHDETTAIRISDHRENLDNFSQLTPEIVTALQIGQLDGKAGIRSSSYDYLPLAGPIADYTQFRKIYAKLAQDKNARINESCPYLPGLFVNVAHGTKGMLTAPICGEIIADYISGTPVAASKSLREALHPNRYYVRELVKGSP